MAKGKQAMDLSALDELKAMSLTQTRETGERERAIEQMRKVDEVTSDQMVLLELLRQAKGALEDIVPKLRPLTKAFKSDQFKDVVELGAPNHGVAKKVQNNLVSRSQELQNLDKYLGKFLYYFEDAEVPDGDEEGDQ